MHEEHGNTRRERSYTEDFFIFSFYSIGGPELIYGHIYIHTTRVSNVSFPRSLSKPNPSKSSDPPEP